MPKRWGAGSGGREVAAHMDGLLADIEFITAYHGLPGSLRGWDASDGLSSSVERGLLAKARTLLVSRYGSWRRAVEPLVEAEGLECEAERGWLSLTEAGRFVVSVAELTSDVKLRPDLAAHLQRRGDFQGVTFVEWEPRAWAERRAAAACEMLEWASEAEHVKPSMDRRWREEADQFVGFANSYEEMWEKLASKKR